MIKEELVRYFAYNIKRGKFPEKLQDEALEKGYSVEDINDSFSVIDKEGKITIRFKKKLSDKLKILILLLLILITVFSTLIVIILSLLK